MARSGLAAIPRTVWTLGVVSSVHGYLLGADPQPDAGFLVSTLGASVSMVGLIEGVGEATAAITKVFSGWISDRLGKRKLLVAHRLRAGGPDQAGLSLGRSRPTKCWRRGSSTAWAKASGARHATP